MFKWLKSLIKRNKQVVIKKENLLFATDNEKFIEFIPLVKDINIDQWLEIPLQNINKEKLYSAVNLSSQILSGGLQTGVIGAAVKNGLYTATIDPSVLMNYSDGSIGSAVMGKAGIMAHRGFVPAGGAIFAPIILFQIMSIVTGQYYLHGISKQLSGINTKLDKLISLFHTERSAKIRQIIKYFSELSKRKSINIEDIVQLKYLMFELGVIHEEYEELLETIDINKIKEADDNFLTSTRINELTRTVQDADIDHKLKTAILTDELYHLSKIIELHLNSKIKDDLKSRSERVAELIDEIKAWTNNEFYFNRIGDIKLRDTYSAIIKTAKKISDEAWLHQEEAKDLENNYKNKLSDLKGFIDSNSKADTLLQFSKTLINSFETPQKVLLYINNNNIKLFLKKGEYK